MTIKELRHSRQRSMSLQKSPFCPPFVAFYPHFAIQSALRAAGASRSPAPMRVATFALVTTVGREPRPASSTPGEPGRAAGRQAAKDSSHDPDTLSIRGLDGATHSSVDWMVDWMGPPTLRYQGIGW